MEQARPRTWRDAKDTSLKSVPLMPALDAEKLCRFTPKERPPLIKSIADGTYHGDEPSPSHDGVGLTNTPPRAYQSELFRSVLGCERNSLVYLPTGLGKTLVAAMVLQRLLELNPGRQAFFLVEANALAMQQVRTSTICRKEIQ